VQGIAADLRAEAPIVFDCLPLGAALLAYVLHRVAWRLDRPTEPLKGGNKLLHALTDFPKTDGVT